MATIASESDLRVLGAATYVRLTTFRRDGSAVATPVWPVLDSAVLGGHDENILVTTAAESGKVKRLRRNRRVLLAVCDARGRVPAGAVQFEAVADVLEDDAAYRRARRLLVPRHPVLARVIGGTRRPAALIARLRHHRPVREVTIQITTHRPPKTDRQ